MNEVDYNKDSVKAAKNAGYNIAFTTNKGFADRDDNPLELDRIYVNSYYDMNTFISILEQTKNKMEQKLHFFNHQLSAGIYSGIFC